MRIIQNGILHNLYNIRVLGEPITAYVRYLASNADKVVYERGLEFPISPGTSTTVLRDIFPDAPITESETDAIVALPEDAQIEDSIGRDLFIDKTTDWAITPIVSEEISEINDKRIRNIKGIRDRDALGYKENLQAVQTDLERE